MPNTLWNVLKEAFHHIGISDFSSHYCGLNVDGASVNLGIHRDVATLPALKITADHRSLTG